VEYVLVSFNEARTVFVDGVPMGKTNMMLQIQEGTHEFNLGAPVNYTPPNKLAIVVGTTPVSPHLIKFEQI